MKKNDIFLIAVVLLVSAVLFAVRSKNSSGGDVVEIYKDNEIYCSLPTDADKTIDIDGKNTVVIKDGQVYMESADCPDQICVKQKPISKNGRDIICLPNGVLVRVSGGNTADAEVG